MKYTKFIIKNFRGIKEIELNLGKSPKANVFTLVGLNESGKTTILDAIAFFYEKINSENQSELHTTAIVDIHDLIPKDQRDSFSGNIEIEASIELDSNDYEALSNLLEKSKFAISENLNPEIVYRLSWRFVNSVSREEIHSIENFNFPVVKKTGKQGKTSLKNEQKNKEVWEIATSWLKSNLPPVIYYPNFLFDFPDRIYLESFEGETKAQKYYRHFLQDVLKTMSIGFTIENYLLNRAKSNKSQDKETLHQAVSKISRKITDLVTAKNLTVLDIYTKGKEISLEYPALDEEKLAYYIDFKLKDGINYYWVRERSLGYKWFLTFLLLTQFRVTRHEGQIPIFIFDEPASNLHQTAQQRLVNALKQLIESSKAQVIYATHSHHLINPDWLENTFIAKNLALDYSDDVSFDARQTNISLTRYREFVSKYPDQTNYFQIILDVLEYRPSNLENIPDIVMIEGKNDGYTLSYMQNMTNTENKINVLPGGGSGSLDCPIRLYYAWGRNFIIILDDDTEGRKQKSRYISLFGQIIESRIFTLKDIDSSWDKYETEDLFSPTDKILVQQKTDPTSSIFHKDNFNRSIQELLINNIKINLSEKTLSNFRSYVKFCKNKLDELK